MTDTQEEWVTWVTAPDHLKGTGSGCCLCETPRGLLCQHSCPAPELMHVNQLIVRKAVPGSVASSVRQGSEEK